MASTAAEAAIHLRFTGETLPCGPLILGYQCLNHSELRARTPDRSHAEVCWPGAWRGSRSTILCNPSGTLGATRETDGGSSFKIAAIVSAEVALRNAGFPASISYRTTPNARCRYVRRQLLLELARATCSRLSPAPVQGMILAGSWRSRHPSLGLSLDSAWPTRSQDLDPPSFVTQMFSGFRSRWTIPAS